MAEVIRMPQLSDTMEEGVISKWLKKEGDKIASGEVIAEVETDKATMEMESFEEGTLLHIAIGEGESVPVDSVIAVVGEEGENYLELIQQEQKEEVKTGAQAETTSPEAQEEPQQSASNGAAPEKEKSEASKSPDKEKDADGRLRASPLAKSMARENNLNLEKIEGSGDYGRIVKRDVLRVLEQGDDEAAVAAPTTEKAAEPVQEGAYEDVKVSQMRKTIAKRLSDSKFTAPHFYLNVDINMDEAIDARKRINNTVAEEHKISFNDLVIKAAASALRHHPQVNATFHGDSIRYHTVVNIGVAIAVDEGLLVPVVRNADRKGMSEIAVEVRHYAKKAQNKELQPPDWEGNTFTISNLGMFGIDDFTAIINPPDSAILAVGRIKEQAVSINGRIQSANMMRVTLSCDHRIVDGAIGARFLQTFKSNLESPIAMLA